jgi:hypothetical protein
LLLLYVTPVELMVEPRELRTMRYSGTVRWQRMARDVRGHHFARGTGRWRGAADGEGRLGTSLCRDLIGEDIYFCKITFVKDVRHLFWEGRE